MQILRMLYGLKAKKKSKPETKPMRCFTPIIQKNQDNPNFFIAFKRLRSDGSMKVERLFPNSGKSEFFIQFPDGSIEDSDAQS